MRYSLFLLLFPFLTKAQLNDSCLREVGISMNLFPGLIIQAGTALQNGNFPKKNEGLYPAYDGYGLNWRLNSNTKWINRIALNFNSGIKIRPEKFISGNICAGHEFFNNRKINRFYFGAEFACRYQRIFKDNINNYYSITYLIGPLAFVGYKAKLSKRIIFRTEIGMGVFWGRANFIYTDKYRQGFIADSYKFGSLELFYSF